MGGWRGGQARYVTVPYADFNLFPFADRAGALEKIAEAFRHEASGRHFGKICLSW